MVVLAPTVVRLAVVPTPPGTGFLRGSWSVAWDVFSLWKVRIILLAGAVSLVSWIFATLWRRVGRVWDLKILIPIAGYLVLVVISAVLSPWPRLAVFGSPGQYEGALVIGAYAAFFLAGRDLFRSSKAKMQLLISLLGAALLVGFLAILQGMGVDPFHKAPLAGWVFGSLEGARNFGSSRDVFSTLGNSTHLGSFIALILPLFATLTLTQGKTWSLRLLWIPVNLCLLVSLLMSGNRGGAIAAVAGSVTGVALTFRKEKSRSSKWFGFGMALFITLVGIYLSRHSLGRFTTMPDFRQFFKQESASNPIRHFSVQQGKAILVLGDVSIVLGSDSHGLMFSRLDGTPLPYSMENGRIVIASKGYENILLRMKSAPQGRLLSLTAYYLSVDLLIETNGVRLFVWNGPLESQAPARMDWPLSDSSFSTRGFIWARTLPLIKERILFGAGPGTLVADFPQRDFFGKAAVGLPSNSIVDRPHSLYLQVAHGSGLVSLLLVLWIVAHGGIRALRNAEFGGEDSTWGYPLAAGLFGYLAASLCNDSFVGVAPLFWTLLGVATGLSTGENENAPKLDLIGAPAFV